MVHPVKLRFHIHTSKKPQETPMAWRSQNVGHFSHGLLMESIKAKTLPNAFLKFFLRAELFGQSPESAHYSYTGPNGQHTTFRRCSIKNSLTNKVQKLVVLLLFCLILDVIPFEHALYGPFHGLHD